ncbi:type II toxin-antitoxin system RelE/ParE family toxin [Candidatus Beckwithbacteria bacterium CG10_big_fil_rev_8_21_14_0_10_34_10]|uniref:Type II toxin-antitoxin system RelE/ParE family toxin n=1 Tax=Candidatus Beckwithbacteria bacterium CG10_big_fil_rev_8_21_14_0_10_34_10 TaxID=1974495 RepID=A0A2H0W993_9BACT|nr:MAG: type II toxin-antitoxin system RelE/ParE family toxin [Candidatus Beckwithbacteria bacterium CG10_big_fil_rev_8_21_14_0_10_34_10]
MPWRIDYYQTHLRKYPVYDFIEKLPEKSQTKIYHTFELLAEFGPQLKLPHIKKIINTPLWELRVLGEKSLRFFYIAKVGKSFLFLHGFTKKSQKTPKKEIKTALNRLKDYQNKNKQQNK